MALNCWKMDEEISNSLLVQLYGLPLRWGTDLIWRFITRNRKGLVEKVKAAGGVDSNYSVGSFSLRFCEDERSMLLL